MDATKIKEISKKLVTELFRNPDIISELCTANFTAHHLFGGDYTGPEIISVLKKNISDPRMDIDDCFTDGERVAVRFRAAFPHDAGEVVRNEIAIIRFKGDKVAEWWGAYDRKSEEEQREQE